MFGMKELNPIVICNDGMELSIQASNTHYCRPRDDIGPYSHVEVGFPTVEPVEFIEYAENSNEPLSTVYGFVPVELV